MCKSKVELKNLIVKKGKELGLETSPPSGHERTLASILAKILKVPHKCVECGADDDLTIDHIVPKSKGGSNDFKNLQIMCRTCNGRKGNDHTPNRKSIGNLSNRFLICEIANPTDYDKVDVALEIRERFDNYKRNVDKMRSEMVNKDRERRSELSDLKKRLYDKNKEFLALRDIIKNSTNMKKLKEALGLL